jgi:glutamate-5-semialdehyde dehydrogenase
MDQLTTATDYLVHAAVAARAASHTLARSSRQARDDALRAMADALRDAMPAILAANAADVAAYRGTAAFLDRLTLTEARVEAMARGLEEVAALPDPLHRTLAEWTRPNGLHIQRIAAPIGVIGMIYESRPNVGADAAALCLKSGNAVILRGGSDSANSAYAINLALRHGLAVAGLPEACVQVAPNTDRAYVAAMLAGAGLLDLIIPRGGKSLVQRVQLEARVPVLAHAEGLNHTFIHAAADPAMARRIPANRGMWRDRDAADRSGDRRTPAAAVGGRPARPRLQLPRRPGRSADRARAAGRVPRGFRHRMAGFGAVDRGGGRG